MEMIQYTPPVSWDDKGMDWESPDPGKCRLLPCNP